MTARRPRRLLRLLALCLAVASHGCGEQVDLVAVPVSASMDGADGAAPSAAACADPAAVPAELAAILCAGEAVLETLKRPLCICEDHVARAGLYIDGLGGQPAGEAAVDGALQLEDSADVDGSLRVAGGQGLVLGEGRQLSVTGDLRVASELSASGADIAVGGDAQVGARLAARSLSVTGALTLPQGAPLDVTAAPQLGELKRAPVQLAPVCPCEPLVLPAAPLPGVPDVAADVEVCGFAALPAVHSDGDLRLSGSGVVVVDGDLALAGRLEFSVPPGAALQVWVRGNLRADGGLHMATTAGSPRVHLLVGGSGTLQLQTQSVVHGSLTAPLAELVAVGGLEVTGGLSVRRAALSAPLSVHHDGQLPWALPVGCPGQ